VHVQRSLLVLLLGCGAHTGATEPAANRSTAIASDPIACPEATLRALAARFPEAKLEVSIVEPDVFDTRGAVELPCARTETDDACLARGRRAIPPGMIEEVFSNGGRGHVDGASEWEITLEVDGRTEVKRRSEPEIPALVGEMYRAMGHRARFISQREIPTLDKRQTVIWYGRQRKHREGALWFGTIDHDVPAEHIVELEHRLHLVDLGCCSGEARREDDEMFWVAHFTCE
jgi:hypothetical protein